MIRDGVPRVVNANEEEQQHRRGDEEEGQAGVGVSSAGRSVNGRVRGQWQQSMEISSRGVPLNDQPVSGDVRDNGLPACGSLTRRFRALAGLPA